MINKKFGDLFAQISEGIEKEITDKISLGERVEEDHITSTLFTLLEERINSTNSDLSIRATQFSGRGKNSAENILGADGAIVLDVDCANTKFKKIILLQAKKLKTHSKFDLHAISQKYKMLAISPDSFFLVYDTSHFRLISALIVSEGDEINNLPAKSLSLFMKDFGDCFIGDNRPIQFDKDRFLSEHLSNILLIKIGDKNIIKKLNLT